MYVRRKKNSSGTISVQVIEKQQGKNIVISSIGCSLDLEEVKRFEIKARRFIQSKDKQVSLDFSSTSKDQLIENYFRNETKREIKAAGPELVLGKIFDQIGFSEIKEHLFKDIVLSRLTYPVSKLKTVEYLFNHKKIEIEPSRVYRLLDRLNKRHKAKIEKISYEHTKKTLKQINIVFYDMTTLYFEAEDEDDLRRIGFSKDGKFQNPQILLGLLIGENGYPIGYDIFEGNTFEGHTLIPTIKNIHEKYGFEKPIIVADSGLLSKINLALLQEQKYLFILGARIKNENAAIKSQILAAAKTLTNGGTATIEKEDGTKLIISYSDKRSKKDAANREKGITRLNRQIKAGKLTKQSIHNRGYNKFLKLDGSIDISIDQKKIDEDRAWDGLKGFITNSSLSADVVIANYQQLWKIEQAFRISKTDLRIRPIFHRKRERIEAHICIAFVAYSIYKELERVLALNKIDLSAQKAIELTKTIFTIELSLPDSLKPLIVFGDLTDTQKALLKI